MPRTVRLGQGLVSRVNSSIRLRFVRYTIIIALPWAGGADSAGLLREREWEW